jgi:hypothetical protein
MTTILRDLSGTVMTKLDLRSINIGIGTAVGVEAETGLRIHRPTDMTEDEVEIEAGIAVKGIKSTRRNEAGTRRNVQDHLGKVEALRRLTLSSPKALYLALYPF